MDVKNIPIDQLIPYEKNPRKSLNVKKVARSIEQFGFQQPIVVDVGMNIVVGHTRYEASKILGLKEVPTVIADISPEKIKAYRIADNRLNQDSLWDLGKLNAEIGDLLDINFDLNDLGFFEKEIENIVVGNDKDIDAYVPTLNPMQKHKDIEEKDINKAKDKERERFDNRHIETREIICPSCYHEFKINSQ